MSKKLRRELRARPLFRVGWVLLLLICCIGNIYSWVEPTLAAPTAEIPDFSQSPWLILGPLPNPLNSKNECLGYQKDYLSSLGGEASAHPRTGLRTEGLTWLTCPASQGSIDFQGIFGPKNDAVAYAYSEFRLAGPLQAALKVGSDDGIKVWLNGRFIWENHTHRALQTDDDAVLVNLIAGINRLLVKIDQGNGGWGFNLRFRSSASEKADWAKIRQPELKFLCTANVFPQRGFISGRVVTVPSFAVREDVRVTVSDFAGKELTSQTTKTGVFLKLPIPKEYIGECRVVVSGTGRLAKISPCPTIAVVGDLGSYKLAIAAKARKFARLLSYTGYGEDPFATLNFLANQLEGKVHPSLCTAERTIRALSAVNELCQKITEHRAKYPGRSPNGKMGSGWPTAMLTGVHQWAYRSVIDASFQPYTLYLPKGYTPVRKYNLLVCLHGYSGDDYGAVNQALTGTKPEDFIVVAPFGRGDLAYRSIGEQDVLDVIELMKGSYAIDPDRVYLTGWSMGGCGAWRIGQLYADRFAAVVPFCGWTGLDFLGNLQNTPVLIVHGNQDPTVPVAMDQAAYDWLHDQGYRVRYDELPGVGHDAWGAWIQNRGAGILYDYLRQFRRRTWPEHATAVAAHLRYGKEFWIRMVELAKPLMKGAVNADIVDERHLRVTTDNVKSFTLNLEHPKLAKTGRILLEIDGSGLAVDAGQGACFLDFSAREQRFVCLKSQTRKELAKSGKEPVKHDGGGLADLFTAPLIIVYDAERGNRIYREAAEVLANWTMNEAFAGTKVGKFRVKSSQEITKADLKGYNLLVIGTDQTVVRLIPDWYRQAPLDFYNQAVQIGGRRFEKSGLMMVCPNPVAPSRLLGLISLPFGEQEFLGFISRLQLNLRLYGLGKDDTASFMTPDVIVLDSPTRIKWAGSFDYLWRNLHSIDYN